jgi:hypothetical protein
LKQPDFSNARTRRTIQRALGMTLGCLHDQKPRELGTRYIDQYYGQQQNTTGQWLRKTLLVTHKHTWHFGNTSSCKSYTYSPQGVELVKSLLCMPVESSPRHTVLANRNLGIQWANREFDINHVAYTDKSNRLWHPIQNMPKSIRSAYLKGCGLRVQHDIRSAAPSLLYQMSWRYSHGIVLETIDHYIHNKSSVRQQLSVETGLPIQNIKVLINSLFAGAVLGAHSKFSCWEYCNQDRSIIKFLQQHPYISDLIADIKQMWEYLRPLLPVHIQKLKNGGTRRVQMTPRNKWHLYFSLERQIINEIRSYLELVGVKYFLIHDAFVSEPLPYGIDDLKYWILAGSGFNVEFDKEHLSYYD